jgi:GNAT superfamily N-acetyltransferase
MRIEHHDGPGTAPAEPAQMRKVLVDRPSRNGQLRAMHPQLRTLSSLSDIPDRDALEDLVREWYTVAVAELASIDGPDLTVEDAMADFWSGLEAYLAPRGCIVLAEDADGGLLGCGFLRQIGPASADLKRLYVRPAGRGQKLGQALVEARIDAARKLGFKTLYTNTIYINHRMLALYEPLGFKRVPRFPECHEPPEMDHLLIYLRRDL